MVHVAEVEPMAVAGGRFLDPPARATERDGKLRSFGDRVDREACGVSAKIGEERTRRVDTSVFAGEKRTDRQDVPVGESGEHSRLFGPQRQPSPRRTAHPNTTDTATPPPTRSLPT